MARKAGRFRKRQRKTAKSPLFKNSEKRRVREEGQKIHKNSGLGRLIDKSQRVISGRAGKSETTKFYRELDRLSKSGTLKELAKRGGLSRESLSGAVDQYAKTSEVKQELLDELFTSLGPLGELVEALVRPTGRPMTSSLDAELGAAASLVRELGGFALLPSDKAKNRKMVKYLQDQGYTVIKPVRQRGQMPQTEARVIAPTKRGTQRKVIDIKVGGRNRRFKVDDPLITGEMIPVSSSNVHSIGFDLTADKSSVGTLKVRFLQSLRSGGKVAGPMYFYYGVPVDLFMDFRSQTRAPSKGKFVWKRLRIEGTVSGHQYDYRLAGISRGYVPRKATLRGGEEWYVTRQFVGRGERGMKERVFTSGGDMFVRNVGEPNRGRPSTGGAKRGRANRGR